ncbi:hypothetical protein F3Y22_tig00110945pilonHSYRG00233 [Hibiscus syriacus]|uniref:Protein kinase domain-containing protein n=1 Tax=Hibiscus syriacus TaxID=106335 RepID=A0A6A2ZC06_HIBSY|nr:hypothetical protein F3Y22_tig00110945pilonHSYRG00233 [Hibiscus syriacus]
MNMLRLRPSIGYNPLGWTMRVRIALDAAKGREYIHKHVKPYYFYRDEKTNNILLDFSLPAKVLQALSDNENLMIKLIKCVDRNLTHYHKETILQDCVDDNWKQRPDMLEVVFCLSHILASTEEWESQRCSLTEP